MKIFKIIIGIVILSFIVIFLFQNIESVDSTSIKLFWSDAPVVINIILVIIAFVIGCISIGVFYLISVMEFLLIKRKLEKKIKQLEDEGSDEDDDEDNEEEEDDDNEKD